MAELIMFKEHTHINTRTRLGKGQELFEITQSGGKGSNYSSRKESARKFIISSLDHSKRSRPEESLCNLKNKNCKLSLVFQEESHLWQDKYSINPAMIPKFLALSWVKKILATGKSINFLHSVCHNSVPIPGKEAVKKSLQNETSPANLFADPSDNKFHQVRS